MDCRSVIILSMLAVFANLYAESRSKKIVIHVPYKIDRMRHTHTVFKTLHHHHAHREPVHIAAPTEEHEHFHHVHLHHEVPRTRLVEHAQPDFLAAEQSLAEIKAGNVRPQIPLYRRNRVANQGKT